MTKSKMKYTKAKENVIIYIVIITIYDKFYNLFDNYKEKKSGIIIKINKK